MANKITAPSDVTSAADRLMRDMLEEVAIPGTDLEVRLQVMQTATRWVAVKNRMNVVEEGNSFDGWRSAIGGADSGGDRAATPNGAEGSAGGSGGAQRAAGRGKARAALGRAIVACLAAAGTYAAINPVA